MKSRKRRIKIVIITNNGLRHRYFANSLTEKFNVLGIISEKPVINKDYLEETAKKHFQIRDQKEDYYFKNNENFETKNLLSISSDELNSNQVFEWVVNLNPDFIILYGSSILKNPLLNYFKDKIINMHLGLSPYYRGSGTNFWPLVNREPECIGVTIHLAILKVDAGAILAQIRPDLKVSDRCHDIGCKAIMIGTRLMPIVIQNYYDNKVIPQIQSGEGRLYKRNDFNSRAVLKMQDNFNTGMMEEYLKNKILKNKKYPILCIS